MDIETRISMLYGIALEVFEALEYYNDEQSDPFMTIDSQEKQRLHNLQLAERVEKTIEAYRQAAISQI